MANRLHVLAFFWSSTTAGAEGEYAIQEKKNKLIIERCTVTILTLKQK